MNIARGQGEGPGRMVRMGSGGIRCGECGWREYWERQLESGGISGMN